MLNRLELHQFTKPFSTSIHKKDQIFLTLVVRRAIFLQRRKDTSSLQLDHYLQPIFSLDCLHCYIVICKKMHHSLLAVIDRKVTRTVRSVRWEH